MALAKNKKNKNGQKRKEKWKLPYPVLFIAGSICDRPMLKDAQKFPNSSFTASASLEDHSASDGRISSVSSWCAPVSNEKHYLQVDLGRLYVIYNFVTFGDSTSLKWVTSFNLNYTVDLINWKPVWEDNVRIILLLIYVIFAYIVMEPPL